VQIDAPCLDCGKPLQVVMQDGKVFKADPSGLIGYVAMPFAKWLTRLPYA
jgi:hypothetical protein